MALRVLYFGTPGFAVPSLVRLIGSTHQVVGVVTQPDRPRGRGQKVVPEAVKVTAVEHGLPVFQPTRLKDPGLLEALRALDPDLGVVAAYGRILPAEVLALPRLGLINVHASLLPRWRGAAPVHRAILAGNLTTGVTIMRVVQALDAGPMLAKVTTDINPAETSVELERRLASAGADLLFDTVNRLAGGPDVEEETQDERLVTYASRLERTEEARSTGRGLRSRSTIGSAACSRGRSRRRCSTIGACFSCDRRLIREAPAWRLASWPA